MKYSVLITLCYMLSCLYCIEYNIYDGQGAYFGLEANETYNFYISMTEIQRAKIFLYFYHMNLDGLNPISSVYINEYATRNGLSINRSEIYFSKYFKEDINASVYEADYFSEEIPKNYISIEITPNMKINNDTFFIQVYIFGGYYEVRDDYYFNYIYNFFPGCPYYLTKEAKYGGQLLIRLDINKYKYPFPFDNCTVIEYKDINHTIILESYDFPFYSSEGPNSKIMSSSSYIKNRDTNLVAVKIIPKKYLILSMHVSMTINYYYFDFGNSNTLYLSNIKKTQKYDYLILNLEGKKSQILNISLSMKHNCTINPFNYLLIYESEYAFVDRYSTKSFFSTKMPGTQPKKAFYLITENETEYISLHFDIECDIEQFNITHTLLCRKYTKFFLFEEWYFDEYK